VSNITKSLSGTARPYFTVPGEGPVVTAIIPYNLNNCVCGRSAVKDPAILKLSCDVILMSKIIKIRTILELIANNMSGCVFNETLCTNNNSPSS